ncbi:MAG TPA: GDSL-type esterase/lipase family protein [Gaiellaceae bacterium]|nr:GDSL-type esterase/lipase family protein [Gaiellaceae bacterium]
MPRAGRFGFALLLALSLAGGSALASPQRIAARSLYVEGDSLAVGTSWYLGGYLRGWTMHGTAIVSRHTYQGALDIEQRARAGILERVVVVDLGTNDDPSAVSQFASYVRDVVKAAGPSRCVIWSTINRPAYNGVSYDGYNAALLALDSRYRNLHVFDWAFLAHANPQWFGSDGVHPTNAGYRARAAALARVIKTC